MLICYRDAGFSANSESQIDQANEIIEEYDERGLTLTLRQLYYQFVARDLRPNTKQSYDNLGKLITKARLAGRISWEAIEDRNRESHIPYIQNSQAGVVRKLDHLLAVDMWRDQPYYIEVWIEKEALSNVIEGVCAKFKVPHMACKGYLSASEAWAAGRRMQEAMIRGQQPVILHLGDHDPSGLDMTRDNFDRVNLFTMLTDDDCQQLGGDEQEEFNAKFPGVEVTRLALNMDQVQEYDPPPNFAKLKDSRAGPYVEEFGYESWELDALDPDVISGLVEESLDALVDPDAWNAAITRQDTLWEPLAQLSPRWDDVKAFLEQGDGR